jgi:uncharacterized protein
MDVSPFPYYGPLEPDEVRGREDLIADLTARVSEHRVTALLGPRRYGKTSVLRRVAADVEAAGVGVVWVDFYEVASMADVAIRLDDALGGTRGSLRERLSRIAGALTLNLGIARVEFRAPAPQRPDPLMTVHSLLDVLIRAAVDAPMFLVFDEFSSVARVEHAAGLLRTHLQHQFRTLGLVFAGSEPSMMRLLFSDREQPFYAQADLVEIGPLSNAAVVEIVNDGFSSTGRRAGPVPERVAAFTKGHPQRSMQLADASWRRVDAGGEATLATWADALDEVRQATATGLERLYSALREGEKAVLRVLASGGSVFGAQAALLDLAHGTAQHARRSLLDRGHLEQVGDSYHLVDPLFADWIARRFPV